MDSRTYVPSTYKLTVGTSTGAVHSKQNLSKADLRKRVDSWFKDETAVSLYIEHEQVMAEAAHG